MPEDVVLALADVRCEVGDERQIQQDLSHIKLCCAEFTCMAYGVDMLLVISRHSDCLADTSMVTNQVPIA